MAEEKLSYENIDCEFKELYVSDIKKTVVAFANTEGGVLYIGVKDNGEIVVLSCDDKIKIDGKTVKHEGIISELKEDGTTKQRLVCITVNADNIIKEID